MKDSEFTELVAVKMQEAHERMMRNMTEMLFSGDVTPGDYTPPSKWQLLKWKLRAIRYGMKARILGTWNLWIKGECGFCEHEDWY